VDSTDQRRTLLAPLGYGIKYQVRVTFKKVRANQLLQVTEGNFYFVTAKGGMADGDRYFEGDKTGSEKGSTEVDAIVDFVLNPNSTVNIIASTDSTITYLMEDENGKMHEVTVSRKSEKSEDIVPQTNTSLTSSDKSEKKNDNNLPNYELVISDDENALKVLDNLVLLLKKRSKEKTGNTLEDYPKYDILKNTHALGRYYNGKIEIRLTAFVKPQFSEEEILSVLYHEYWHFYSEKNKKYVFRKKTDGYIYSIADVIEIIPNDSELKEIMQDEGIDVFSLSEKRKMDLRIIYKKTVSYRPSALCEEEVFCYKKQLNGHHEDIYKIKQEFIQSLQESQRHFERLKPLMVKYEQENNLNSAGYEN
jgi:hypothetical protein